MNEIYESGKLFNMDLIDMPDFLELIIKFSFNMLIVLVLVRICIIRLQTEKTICLPI